MREMTIAVIADPTDATVTSSLCAALTRDGAQVTPLIGRAFDASVRTLVFEADTLVVALSPAALASKAWRETAEFAVYVAEHLPTRAIIAAIIRPVDDTALPPFLQEVARIAIPQAASATAIDELPLMHALGLTPTATEAASRAERLRWGKTRLSQGRYDDALAFFQALTQEDADDADAWLIHGLALDRLERYEEALAAFDRALALRPTSSKFLRVQALTLYAMKRLDAALAADTAALQIDPADPFTLVNRALVLHAQQRYDEALTSSLMALDIIPDFHKALNVAIDYLRHLQLLDRQRDYLQRLIATAPDWPSTWYWQAQIALTDGETAQGMVFVEKYLAYDPPNETVWRMKLNHLFQRQDYQRLLVESEKALTLLPENASFLNSRGIALEHLGRTTEAIGAYRAALQSDPRFVAPMVNAADILRQQRQYSDAAILLDQALRLEPDRVLALNGKILLLIDQGQAAEALPLLDHALALDDQNVDLWNNRGWALIRLERYAEALPALERAIAIDPKYVRAWQNKAFALAQLRRRAEARVAQHEADILDPQAHRQRVRARWSTGVRFVLLAIWATLTLLVLLGKFLHRIP